MPAPAFLSRLFRKPVEKRDASVMDVLAAAYDYKRGGTRGGIGPRAAEALGAVQACVALICGAMSSLPAALTIDTPDGRAPAPSAAAAWRLLRRPNDWQSWPAFMSWASAQFLLRGNILAPIETDGAGRVTALQPVQWEHCNPVWLPSQRLAYDVTLVTPAGTSGPPRRYLQDEVLHVRARSDDGLIGRSVLSRAAGPLNEAVEIAGLALDNWRNGLRTSGIISMQGSLGDKARDRLKARIAEQADMDVLILDQSAKFEQMALSSVDAEFLGSRQFSVSDIARLFSVPEPLLQLGQRALIDPTPFVSLFAMQALAPIVTAIEAEFDHAVLPAGMHLVLDMSGLMRGSFSAIAAALCATTQSGITTANDAGEHGMAAGTGRRCAPCEWRAVMASRRIRYAGIASIARPDWRRRAHARDAPERRTRQRPRQWFRGRRVRRAPKQLPPAGRHGLAGAAAAAGGVGLPDGIASRWRVRLRAWHMVRGDPELRAVYAAGFLATLAPITRPLTEAERALLREITGWRRLPCKAGTVAAIVAKARLETIA